MTLEAAERRRRELASNVKRLRVAAMSDPQRSAELADALVELTANHLLAWDLVEAAALAPEAVVQSARILAARGPAGPYASLPDATRYFSASAQLAAVQAALGQREAAARTLDGLDGWRQQVARLPLAGSVPDEAALWALLARARALLDTDPATANALADAAELRLHAVPAAPPYLALAVHLLTAEARWAAGLTESALAHSRLALQAHTEALADPAAARRPAVARTALAPVPAVYESYARRLAATGDRAGAISLRRAEVALLESFPGAEGLGAARAGLAGALAAAGRGAEATGIAAPDGIPDAAEVPTGRLDWDPLPAGVVLARGEPGPAAERWRQAEQAAMFAGAAARAEAERTEADLAQRAEEEARRRAAAQAEAERAAAAAALEARARQEASLAREAERAAERAERERAAARAAAEERRRARAAEHRADVDPKAARAAAAELDRARHAVHEAHGDAALAVAFHRLADVLRPLAAADHAYTDELGTALESLVGLLWRLGDPDGSRAAAREAKSLGG